MTVRILELAEQLEVDPTELIAVCALLEIPASSRISCIKDQDTQRVIDYLRKE
tara:strand:+ start:223 stop:381 length:159 start_codon:yes stop_codon:yes gene_type:complete